MALQPAEDNPARDEADPLAAGRRLLEEGDLPSAVHCFEAAVEREPGNSEAWQLLGRLDCTGGGDGGVSHFNFQ